MVYSHLEPVQIIIPDNPPTLSQPTVNKLPGGGGCSWILLAICIFFVLCLLGFFIGTVVSFSNGNTTGGIVCLIFLILFCCICGGGGSASKAKTGHWIFVED